MEEEFELLKGAFSKTEIEDQYLTCILHSYAIMWSFKLRNSTCHSFANKSLTPLVLTMQWYIDVLARIHINAFRIELSGGSYTDLHSLASASVVSEASVGNAVYMLPSFYNHDCGMFFHIHWCFIFLCIILYHLFVKIFESLLRQKSNFYLKILLIRSKHTHNLGW